MSVDGGNDCSSVLAARVSFEKTHRQLAISISTRLKKAH